MMLLLVHGAMNNRTSSRDLKIHVERDLFMKPAYNIQNAVDGNYIIASSIS